MLKVIQKKQVKKSMKSNWKVCVLFKMNIIMFIMSYMFALAFAILIKNIKFIFEF